MAITTQITDSETGTVLPNAYIKIPHFAVWTDNLVFGVHVFSNQQARLDEKRPIRTMDCSVPFNGSVTYSELYTYLKTLPEFANAIDC